MPLKMNVCNFFLSLFLLLPFPNGGGIVAIGRTFVQVGETIIMWRIAYLGERINLETFKIVLVYLLLFSFVILIWWHSVGTYWFHIKEIFSCWSFHFGLKGFFVTIQLNLVIRINENLMTWGSSFWIISLYTTFIFSKDNK